MARLIIKDDGDERVVELSTDDITSVGRDDGNTIPLELARGISRRHCQITPVRRDGHPAFEMNDLGATNKTRVNGKPTDRALLTSGDVIAVGSVELTFEDKAEEDRLRDAGRQGVCYLEWVTGGTKGEKVMLDQPRISLGRRDSNSIKLEDRMSSSHHCEITKDLNGYTIRDLGSTNGTLVNGEPTSETQLMHGARIRIGNSRFVFKDPSMKDIEVELSQFEEDEGWGMMGDIDMTKARGSYAGLLVGLVILAAAGVGGWFISQEAEKNKTSGGVADVANLVEIGETDEAGYVAWGLDQESDDARVRVVKGALEVRHTGEDGAPITAWFQDELEALADEPFELSAKFRGSEGSALVATWRSDNHAVSRTMVLAAGGQGSQRVNRVLVKPTWAGGLRLGVRAEAGASGKLESVRVVRGGEGSLTSIASPGSSSAYAEPNGAVDLVDSVGRALALGLTPVAMKGGATMRHFVAESVTGGGDTVTITGAFEDAEDAMPATVTWTKTEEGLAAKVDCAGADSVGLSAGLVRSRVGDLVNVLTPAGARALAASGGQGFKAVRKTLAGNLDEEGGGRTSLVTFVTDDGAELKLSDTSDSSLLAATHWLGGASASVALVTDYTLQSKQAQTALSEAQAVLRDQPGVGIEKLRQVAVEFPFEPALVEVALEAAATRETRAKADIDALERALHEFKIYRSDESLATAVSLRDRLAKEFPPRADGLLERRVEELVAGVDSERATYFQEVKGPELNRLEELAALLSATDGYKPMAVLFLRTIEREFADVQADTPMGRRVAQAKATLATMLKSNPNLAEHVPPMPGGAK